MKFLTYYDEVPVMNFDRFKRLYRGDYDSKEYIRTFSGKITKGRYKALESYCRRYSFCTSACGHDYDCCGCMCGQSLELSYKHNRVTIIVSQSFNY